MSSESTDYLIIGAGAVGLAFADTLLDETDATITIVDREHAPGGHWVHAYPFVRLHQPSAFYGVASKPLGSDRIDTEGPNKGFFELASGTEVAAYFEAVMREKLLPSGRVTYLPMTNYEGNGKCISRLSGEETHFEIAKREVDGTFMGTNIPLTHERKFEVGSDVVCIPPNDLPLSAPKHRHFTILGGGKTACDTAVWLLQNGVPAQSITWVRPREAWMINRLITQPSAAFFEQSIGAVANQMEAMAAGTSATDVFLRLESTGNMLRLDTESLPTMFHYATISEGEVDLLRQISNVVRGQHVAALTTQGMTMADGSNITNPESLYIDCTACAASRKEAEPVFQPGRIVPQMIRLPQPAFSASLIAYLEAHYDSDEKRNELSKPFPIPDTPFDWMEATVANMTNQFNWSQDKKLRRWIDANRLDGFGKVMSSPAPDDEVKQDILKRLRNNAFPGVANLMKLIEAKAV